MMMAPIGGFFHHPDTHTGIYFPTILESYTSQKYLYPVPFLKGLSHETDLAFDDIYMFSSALKRGRAHLFLFFRCYTDFITQKVYF
jgi:hypothetical protein